MTSPPPGTPFPRILGRLTARLTVDSETLARLQKTAPETTLVYVLPSASLVDYFLMNSFLDQQELPNPYRATHIPEILTRPVGEAPRALFAGIRALFRRPSFRLREECRELVDDVAARRSILIFLNRPGLFSKPPRWNVPIWEELIRAERKGKTKVAFVPAAILWGRRPGHIQRTWAELLFGDPDAPGTLRKTLLFLRRRQDISLRIGNPIHLAGFLAEAGPGRDEVTAKKLRRLLTAYLYRERKLLAGPPIRSRSRIIRTLLKDPELQPLVAGVARREKKTTSQIWKRAEEVLREMIADYHPRHVAISHKLFRWLWSRLYDDIQVDEQGLEQLKRVSRDYPVILVPSHKSHMDYMLLSALLYERGMMPPHIAAGINLAFWPVGPIFRRNGAFFIRRTISGDLLYARLLGLYVRWLVRTGYSQEFFIEGGRTRTGKLVFPKHGLLGMQVDAIFGSHLRDIYVIPIAITYERVLEESSYRAELSGKKKEKESLTGLLKSRKLLARRHGAAYVRFSQPISAREYFKVEPGMVLSAKVRKERVVHLAHEIIRRIADETVVTATALVATALLAQRERGILESTLRRRLAVLISYLRLRKAPLSPGALAAVDSTHDIVAFFLENRWIVTGDAGDRNRLLIVREDRRINLDFYKNTILHAFLPAALAATVDRAKSSGSVSPMALLRGIFANEFSLDENISDDEWLSKGRALFESDEESELFASLIRNYLESYAWAAEFALAETVTHPLDGEALLRAMALGNRLFATGEITRREAVSVANVRSAVAYFHAQGLLKDRERMSEWQRQIATFAGS